MNLIPARRRAAIIAVSALLWSLAAASAPAADRVSQDGYAAFEKITFSGSAGLDACCAGPRIPARPSGAVGGVATRVGGAPELAAELGEQLLRAGATVEALGPFGWQPREAVIEDGSASVEVFGDWSSLALDNATGWVRFSADSLQTGTYPVYVRAGEGASLYDQEYIVGHANGETRRSVNHRAAGQGWIYLGSFRFDGWGFVEVSNRQRLDDSGELAIPAAVRFGNGAGDDAFFAPESRSALYQPAFSRRLADKVNERLSSIDSEWTDASTSAFTGGVYKAAGRDAVEVVFRDPLSNGASIGAFEAREAAARAAYLATAEALAERAGEPEALVASERPGSFELFENARGRHALRWSAPAGPAPIAYMIEASNDGFGFSDAQIVAGDKLEADVEGLLLINRERHLRVSAVNEGGRSLPTEPVSMFHAVAAGYQRGGASNCGMTGEPDIELEPDPGPLVVPGPSARGAAPTRDSTLDVCAFFGDVSEIDLTLSGGANFAVTGNPSNGVVAQIDNYTSVISSGTLYYVPNIPDDGEFSVADTGTDTITLSSSTGTVTVNISIEKGYTDTCPADTSNKLNTYRVQQRLKYFNYRTTNISDAQSEQRPPVDQNGAVMGVDGLVGSRTRWAIGTFNAACTYDSGHAASATLNAGGSSFINAGNAPRWQETAASGTNWSNIDTGADNQDWGTSWAAEVIEAAGVANSTGSNIETNDLSYKRGGGTPDHSSHEGGMDIDVDTPSLDRPSSDTSRHLKSFCKVHSNGQLVGSNGGTITNGVLVWNGSAYVVQSSGAGETALAIFNNAAKLGRPGLADGIVDNDAYNYVLSTVEGHIEAFRGVSGTPSGAAVGSIYHNDPRTWHTTGVPVGFSTDHNGHFHVNISVPTPTANTNMGGTTGGGGGNPPPSGTQVVVNTADIATNTIGITLSPSTSSGVLTVKLDNHVVYTATHSGGSVTANFGNIDSLPEQEFQNVVATWNVGGSDVTGMKPYHIKVLGMYRHSQYNIPAQSHATCAGGGTVGIHISTASCTFVADNFSGTFRSQTALNGRGTTNSYGIASVEFFCVTHPNNTVGATQGFTFRRNQQSTGSCSGLMVTGGSTVAAKGGHPDLTCGDNIYIHSSPSGGVSKTVTDQCPACGPPTRSDYKQLDNFISEGRCSGITDFGNFKTIKIF